MPFQCNVEEVAVNVRPVLEKRLPMNLSAYLRFSEKERQCTSVIHSINPDDEELTEERKWRAHHIFFHFIIVCLLH